MLPMVSKVKKGEQLWTDSRFDKRIYIIQSGVFVSLGDGGQEGDIPFAVFGQGIATGMAELYAPEELCSTYHIRNMLPGEICAVSAKAVRRKLESVEGPYAQRVICCALINESTSAFMQAKIAAKRSIYDRILALLLYLHDLTGRNGTKQYTFALTHEEIAQLISADRVSTTRVLRRMGEEGVVDVGYKSVTLRHDVLSGNEKKYQVHTQFALLNDASVSSSEEISRYSKGNADQLPYKLI